MGDHASHGKHKMLIIKTLLQIKGGEGVRLRLAVEIRGPDVHHTMSPDVLHRPCMSINNLFIIIYYIFLASHASQDVL